VTWLARIKEGGSVGAQRWGCGAVLAAAGLFGEEKRTRGAVSRRNQTKGWATHSRNAARIQRNWGATRAMRIEVVVAGWGGSG